MHRLFAAALALTLAWPVAALAETKAEQTEPSKLTGDRSLAGNYLAARVAATDRDTEAATVFYRKAIKLDPDNVDLKLKAFLSFIANGDFEEGVGIAAELERAGREPAVAHLLQAVADIRSKAWKQAETRLTRDWRSALDRLLAKITLAWAQQGGGNTDAALATIDGMQGPDWYDLFTQYHGGLIALASGRTADGRKRLETAYANENGGRAAPKTYNRIIHALAAARQADGDRDGASKLLDEALRNAPQNPVFERLRARAAQATLEAPVRNAQAGAAEVFLNVGNAIDRDGGRQFARIYLQLARTLAPESAVVLAELGDLYDRQSLLPQANRLFAAVPEGTPYHRMARLEMALNLDELDKQDEAIAALDALVAEAPDDLVVNLSYGAVLARRERFTDAAELYEKLIARIGEPKDFHWNLYYRLGIAYERSKQWPKAEAAFRQALQLYPDQPNVLNYLGYSWIDMNANLQEGLDLIRKAVDLRPNDGYIVDSLGWAYYRMGRFSEAVEELERAVELRPGDPTINDHLGDAYWRMNRRLEAMFQWRHALALDPPKEDIPKIEAKLKDGLPKYEPRTAAPAKEEPAKDGEDKG